LIHYLQLVQKQSVEPNVQSTHTIMSCTNIPFYCTAFQMNRCCQPTGQHTSINKIICIVRNNSILAFKSSFNRRVKLIVYRVLLALNKTAASAHKTCGHYTHTHTHRQTEYKQNIQELKTRTPSAVLHSTAMTLSRSSSQSNNCSP